MATKLRKLKIDEVSPVVRPANQGADILIIKADDEGGAWKPCDDCPDSKVCKAKGKCMGEGDGAEKGMGAAGCAPGKREKRKWKLKKADREALEAALGDVEKAREVLVGKAEDEVGADILALTKALAVEHDFAKAATMFDDLVGAENEREMLWRATRALNDSIHSIMADGQTKAKPKLLRTTLNQFVAYLEGEFDIDGSSTEDDDDDTAEKGDGANAASGGDRAGGSGQSEGRMTTMAKQAPGDAEAINKANAEKDAAIAKAAALEKANKEMSERLTAIEKAQEEQRITKTVDEIAGNQVGVDKAKLREVVSKLDAAGIEALKATMHGLAKQQETSKLFEVFGKSDAPAAGEAGAVALKKSAEAAAERLRKAASQGRA